MSQEALPDDDPRVVIARHEVDDHRCVISVSGEVDLDSVLELEWAVEQALIAGCDCVVVDLAETAFMDAAAVGALADWCRRAVRRAGALVVAGPTPDVRRVFAVTALDDEVPIFESADAALATGPPPC